MQIVVKEVDTGLKKICFSWSDMSEQFTNYIRKITNIDGIGENAYDVEKFNEMPPQDELVNAYGWIHSSCSLTCQFEWASGRKDGFVLLEDPNKTEEQKYLDFCKGAYALLGDSVNNFVSMKKELENAN